MHNHKFLLMLGSFAIGLLLSVYQLPTWLSYLSPAWIALLIAYWSLAMPHRVGMGTACLLGIFLDALNATALGEHALALVMVSYFVLRSHRQLRMYPRWQQTFCIMLIIFGYQFVLFCIQGILKQPTVNWQFLLPAISSAVCWPILCQLLQSRR